MVNLMSFKVNWWQYLTDCALWTDAGTRRRPKWWRRVKAPSTWWGPSTRNHRPNPISNWRWRRRSPRPISTWATWWPERWNVVTSSTRAAIGSWPISLFCVNTNGTSDRVITDTSYVFRHIFPSLSSFHVINVDLMMNQCQSPGIRLHVWNGTVWWRITCEFIVRRGHVHVFIQSCISPLCFALVIEPQLCVSIIFPIGSALCRTTARILPSSFETLKWNIKSKPAICRPLWNLTLLCFSSSFIHFSFLIYLFIYLFIDLFFGNATIAVQSIRIKKIKMKLQCVRQFNKN